MIYLLDADIINYAIKGNLTVDAYIRRSVVAQAEFVLSPMVHFQVTRYLQLKRATRSQRNYAHLIANWQRVELVGADWDDAADLWADRHRLGKPIDDADLLIAITAKKTSAILVTNNTRHFEDLGVTLENWTV